MSSAPNDDDGSGDEPTDEPRESTASRRWLIRILVGLGLGIPIAIEGITFVGLVRNRLLGDGDDGGDPTRTPSPTPTRTRTPVPTIPPGGVGVGDELLPSTRQVDRVQDAVVVPSGDVWRFSFTVAVENTGDERYEVTLGSVWTEAGERITGGNFRSGQIEPGTKGAVTGTWEIPPESTPASLQVIAVEFPSGDTVSERVPLGDVPVRDDAAGVGG